MKRILLLLIFLPTLLLNAQNSRWQVKLDTANIFSSPRFSDLNQDGIKDVVIGAGVESKPVSNGIVAINGKDGSLLWQIPTRTQIYTSALFQDVNNDGVEDVFIGGRAASYYAIDGATGEILWQFWEGTDKSSRKIGLLNFFSTQWIDDQNNDGFKDLLVTNGGDYLASAEQKKRPTAQLMILSGKTGETIANAKIPEERESYYAPTLIMKNEVPTVLFGTGGETIDGGLWEMPLSELLKNKSKKSNPIVHDTLKGFIINSVLADINNDQHLDILSARLNATIQAIDGASNTIIWEHYFEGYECYVTPTLGQFVGDNTPDFFTIIAEGTFPIYTSFKLIIIDGGTGEIAYEEKTGFNQFSPAIAMDINNDGIDEIVYVHNTLISPESYFIVNQLRVVDIKNNDSYFVGPIRTGLSMASSPGIIDLEEDGKHEIIVATSSLDLGDGKQYSIIECIDLNKEVKSINWPGYLGPFENGILIK